MNKWKKTISAGMSAALLASLFTVIAASSALASVTVTSAGSVPQGGTSAGTATFVLTERAIDSIPTNAAGSIDIVITDSASLSRVEFDGTPVVSAPGSLGASAVLAQTVVANDTLRISWTHSDPGNIESITVTGLAIDADSDATTGAIKATLTNPTGNASVGAFQAGGNASGFLATGVSIGATSATVNVTTTGCTFTDTGVLGSGKYAFAAGIAGTTAESLDGTAGALNTPLVGQQVLTITTALGFTSAHNAGDVVSQTTACAASGVLSSPGTVAAALTYVNPPTKLTVFPGENNSPASNLVLVEPSAGFLPAASTFTYTIATAGVVFSTAPTVSDSNVFAPNEVQTITITGAVGGSTFDLTFGANTTGALPADTATAAAVQTALTGLPSIGAGNVTVTGGAGGPYTVTFVGTLAATNVAQMSATASAGVTIVIVETTAGAPSSIGAMVLSAPVLSGDRKSATVTVTTASTLAGATITLSNILYDVAATVPGGTFISVGVTTSGALAVLPASRTNAVVFRGITATATSPIVYIGENNQAAGIISFTEAAPGFFTASPGPNNTFEICPAGVTYVFTTAPYAKVTGGVAAGNLILRDGAAASTTNIVKGTQVDGVCYFWTVWTASTTASTIQIGNVDLTTGPLINVNVTQAPGPVLVQLYIGSSALDDQLVATVQFATAMYRNQVAVTALSQPSIAAGALHAAAGNIQIAETGLGQLKAGESICVEVLWRSFGNNDVFLNGLTTADLPVATSSGTGLVIGPVSADASEDCQGVDHGDVPAQYIQSFSFPIMQQSTAGDGKVVISNINYTTLPDAVTGPVQVSVWGFGGSPTGVVFHSTVSNARIGAQLGGTNATRLGVTQVGAFTISTKVAALRHYVTYRFDFGVAAAGQIFVITGATKTGNDWSAFTVVTSRRANASGVVYYYIRQNSATWKSYRASWAGGGVITLARQARWR